MKRRGFTLIELLVVISIIGLLSSIVLTSLNTARLRANDARRKADMNTAINALALYYFDHGNYVEAGSGCGSGGNGNGWFNIQGSSYPISIAQCLVDGGYVGQEIIDPTGARSASAAGQQHAYMKYSCSLGTYMYASLATEDRFVDGPTNSTCCTTCDTSYGMNYWKRI